MSLVGHESNIRLSLIRWLWPIPDERLTGSWPVATLKRRVAQKCFLKSYRAVKSALIEPDLISRLRWAWNTGVVPGYVPRGRKAEDGRIDDRYNLIELSTSSYPARTKRNIEESDDTVIFSLERLLSGGTELTRELADKRGKPVLHIYDSRKERRFEPGFASPRDSSAD